VNVCSNKPIATGIDLFPGFASIYGMVHDEVIHLNDQQLDWTSDIWEWSKWNIRRQISHIAAASFSWLLIRWKNELFPNGYNEIRDLADYTPSPNSPEGRWLDEGKYVDLSSVLTMLMQAMKLDLHVLRNETAGSIRKKELPRPDTWPHWHQFEKAHPNGVRWHPSDPNFSFVTLEATFRHLYFDAITHIYNIQRLKRAQGLAAVVEVPFQGYWALPDWDRSEP